MEVIQNKNNCLVIRDESYLKLFSYNTEIATYNVRFDDLKLTRKWDYSNTTLKHLYNFIDYGIILHNKYNDDVSSYIEVLNSRNRKTFIRKKIDNKSITIY